MATEMEKSKRWGSEGGNKTLEMFGRKHFQRAAEIRWKAYRLAQKSNGKKK